MCSAVFRRERGLPGQVDRNDGVSPITGLPWMNDFLEVYRKVIENHAAKNTSVHNFLNGENLQDAHKSGMEEVWKLFTEYKKSVNECDPVEKNMEEKLKGVLEKEFSWIRELHFDKFQIYIESGLEEIIQQGKESLESRFTFDPNPTVEYYSDDKITFLIAEVTKQKVGEFQDKIPLEELGERMIHHKEKQEDNLKTRLEKIGKEEGAKYKDALEWHLKSRKQKCITAYKTEMEITVLEKTLREIEQIEENHFKLEQRSLEMLVAEIGINAPPHFYQLSIDISKVFQDLMNEKQKDVSGICVSAVRNVFYRCQVKYQEGSDAENKILAGIKEMIANAVEPTMDIVSKNAGAINTEVKKFENSLDEVDLTMENGTDPKETSYMDLDDGVVTGNGKSVEDSDSISNATTIPSPNSTLENFSELTDATPSTSLLSESVSSTEIISENSTSNGDKETASNIADSEIITSPLTALTNQKDSSNSNGKDNSLKITIEDVRPTPSKNKPNEGTETAGRTSQVNDKTIPDTQAKSPQKASDKKNASLSERSKLSSPQKVLSLGKVAPTQTELVFADNSNQAISRKCEDFSAAGDGETTLTEISTGNSFASGEGESSMQTSDDDTCSSIIASEKPTPIQRNTSSSPGEISRAKWRSIEVPNSTHLTNHPPTTSTSKGKGTKGKNSESLQKTANFFQAIRSYGIRFTPKGIIVGVSIDHVPNILVQECSNNQVSIASVESLAIPLLVGLTKHDTFLIGKDVITNKRHQLRYIWDIYHIFRYPDNFQRSNSTELTINGSTVTCHVELLLGILLFQVKLKMEKVIEKKFGRREAKLEKLVVSLPPHFRLFQIQQIRDAAFIAGFKAEYVVLVNEASSLALDFSRRQFSRIEGGEMGRKQGNVLIITQYYDENINVICFSSYNYKTELEKVTKLSIEQLGYQNLPKSAQFVARINMKAPSINLNLFNRIWTLSQEFLKSLPNDCPGLPVFCQLNCEDSDWLEMFKKALENLEPHDDSPTVKLLPCDRFASSRGVVSVGSYGYWWNPTKGKKPDHFEVEIKDSFITYTTNIELEFDHKNLSHEQCTSCNWDLIRIFGNSPPRKNQQCRAASKNKETCKKVDRIDKNGKKSSRKRLLPHEEYDELNQHSSHVRKKTKVCNRFLKNSTLAKNGDDD